MTDRVIIVGGGPVGLVAALRLARLGFPVTVLERATTFHAEPRASTFQAPSLELMEELGLTHRLIEEGRLAPLWQYRIFETGECAVFDYGQIADETRYPYRLQCEQFRLVQAAGDALLAMAPESVVFGAEVTEVRQDPSGVTAFYRINNRIEEARGAWLIGADGATSVVRAGLGTGFPGETYPAVSFTVGTAFDFEKHMSGLLGVNYFWSDHGPFSMFHTRDRWRIGWSPPPGATDEEALSDDLVQAKLAQICPAGAPFDLHLARVYRVHRRVADTFNVGRVFLAGDAAHLNSPAGGFGLNGGIHDAFALTDAMTAVANGGDAALFDRYTRRRRSAAIEDIHATSDANYKRHREKDPAKRLELLSGLQAIIADRDRHRAFLLDNSLINSLRRSSQMS